MPIEQSLAQLQALLRELCHLPNETEWVEFKHNNADAPMVGSISLLWPIRQPCLVSSLLTLCGEWMIRLKK